MILRSATWSHPITVRDTGTMWISNTTSKDLWPFYFRHVQTCSCMLRHVVASLNMPEIEQPQTFCLVVREPPQISNINDTLLGCICVPLTACWWTGGTYWWLYHESHSAPHVTLCAWLYVQTWQLSLHQITFQLKGKFEHLEQSSKTDMVALINECAGQGNLAGIQGMVFEIWHTQNLSKEEHLMQEILKIHR